MYDLSLLDLDLDKHLRLGQAALKGGETLLACDTNGRGVGVDLPDPVLRALEVEPPDGEEAPTTCYTTALDDGTTLHTLPLFDVQERKIGALLVVSESAEEDTERLFSLMNSVAICVVDEFAATNELNDMAVELGGRYEELNLMYAMDEARKNHKLHEDYEVLETLVEDCASFLELSAIILTLPKDGLKISRVIDSEETTISERQLSGMHAIILGLLKTHRVPLVLNDETSPRVGQLFKKFNNRFIAVPIMGLKNDLHGMLVTFRSIDAEPFLNSDRRLIEILADQASVVIQTLQDSLTGLLNRKGFKRRLEECITTAREGKRKYALILMDMDRFKIFNESAGYLAGNALLERVAALLDSMTSSKDIVARIAGNEFGVIVSTQRLSRANAIADKYLTTINSQRFAWEKREYDVGVNIGVVGIDQNTPDLPEVLRHADMACYVAKEEGRRRIHVYQSGDDVYSNYQEKMKWVPEIKRSLEKDLFQLYAQPIVPVDSDAGLVGHVEILIRLFDETGNLVPPGAFLPSAERYNLMPLIDRWVVTNTLDIIEDMGIGPDSTPFHVAINLSGQSFSDDKFLEEILGMLEDSPIPNEWVSFEVTETAAIGSLRMAKEFIDTLKETGCPFSLDDFGAGLSSFSYLKALPLDFVKIDGIFVKDIVENEVSRIMVHSIHKVSDAMGLRTIAEYVENEEILEHLREIGVDYAQGYGIGKPIPLRESLAQHGLDF
ncbi:MAG: EAL domain-containing protein [Magnetococcales bacterium]|nr:EAL domain-containing protein [Magnetococcales bacterium]